MPPTTKEGVPKTNEDDHQQEVLQATPQVPRFEAQTATQGLPQMPQVLGLPSCVPAPRT